MKKVLMLSGLLLLAVNVMALPGISGGTGALVAAKNRGSQQDAMHKLKQIGVAVVMYYVDSNNEQLPPDFSSLVDYCGNKIFITTSDHTSKQASGKKILPANTSFAYVGNLGRFSALRNPAVIPIAFEKPTLLPTGQTKIAVLFADGHVDRVNLPTGPVTCLTIVKMLTADLKDKNLKSKLEKNAAAEDAASAIK